MSLDSFTKAMAALPDGHAHFVYEEGGDLCGIHLSPDEFRRTIARPARVGTIGMLMRPGVIEQQRYLELTYFLPNTGANNLLECLYWKWQGIEWAVTLLPQKCCDSFGVLHDAEHLFWDAAEKVGLRLLSKGCMPVLAAQDGCITPDFPELGRLHFLEHVPGHLFYRDAEAAWQKMKAFNAGLEKTYQARKSSLAVGEILSIVGVSHDV